MMRSVSDPGYDLGRWPEQIIAGGQSHFTACGVTDTGVRRIDACQGRITPPGILPAKRPG